jgi:hypothetical protein
VAEKPRDALLAVAMQLGFTAETFDKALTNQALYEGMEKMKTEALGVFDLEGTPTFYVNGKQLTGDKTLEQLAAEIDPLIPADFKPKPASEASSTPTDPAPAETNAMAAEPAVPAADTNAMSAEPSATPAPAQ